MYVYHTQVLISIHIFSFRNVEENNSCWNHHAFQEQNSFTLLFLVIEEGKEFPTYVEILNAFINYIVMFQDTDFWKYFHFLELLLITEGEKYFLLHKGIFCLWQSDQGWRGNFKNNQILKISAYKRISSFPYFGLRQKKTFINEEKISFTVTKQCFKGKKFCKI